METGQRFETQRLDYLGIVASISPVSWLIEAIDHQVGPVQRKSKSHPKLLFSRPVGFGMLGECKGAVRFGQPLNCEASLSPWSLTSI
jgi:hypothetical protein